jgi:tRNA-intron endonuclease
MFEVSWDPRKGLWAETPEGIERLNKNFFGSLEKGKGRIHLTVEEALYCINFMNAACTKRGKPVSFNELASFYSKQETRLFIRYNAYRDWRDRGLVLKRVGEITPEKPARKRPRGMKRYPSRSMEKLTLAAGAVWYPGSFFSVVEDRAVGGMLFNEHWFGQFGVYRQERGDMLKLNFLETVFLSKHCGLQVSDSVTGRKLTHSRILRQVVRKREYANQLYEVYEDWRLRGYVVKTGFKFGSHFRIYFPGASPKLSPSKGDSEKEWIHSRHVLHVFPKDQRLVISEWARAVRVAHSVRKTFLLSIPEMKKKDYVDYHVDYIAYRRKKSGPNWVRENPKEDRSRYLLVAVSEDDHIGGVELGSLLQKAEAAGLNLLLSITDRETSITYYVLNKVVLPGSRQEYYEIEWMKP